MYELIAITHSQDLSLSLSPFLHRQMNSSLVTFELEMQWHIALVRREKKSVQRGISSRMETPLKYVIIGTVIHWMRCAECVLILYNLCFFFLSPFAILIFQRRFTSYFTSLSKTSRLDGNHRPLLMPTHTEKLCAIRFASAQRDRAPFTCSSTNLNTFFSSFFISYL